MHTLHSLLHFVYRFSSDVYRVLLLRFKYIICHRVRLCCRYFFVFNVIIIISIDFFVCICDMCLVGYYYCVSGSLSNNKHNVYNVEFCCNVVMLHRINVATFMQFDAGVELLLQHIYAAHDI